MRFVISAFATILLAGTAAANEPEKKEAEKEATTSEAPEAKDEKTCRYVHMDMSSRRKERVCLTKEGWIEFNQGN